MKKSSLALLGILTINIFLRLIYVFYGYIATEEGTLIYNQKLAYSGLLPFVHYDAWNSSRLVQISATVNFSAAAGFPVISQTG